MNLIQMSFSGAILILAVIIIRAITIHRLPKKTFLALWGIVLLRLLLPLSIPSTLSVYSFVSHKFDVSSFFMPYDQTNNSPLLPNVSTENNPAILTTPDGNLNAISQIPTAPAPAIPKAPVPILPIVYGVGLFLCITFFTISYLRCRFEFQTSLPVQNDFTTQWLKEHLSKRPISIKQSDRILAPLTYGIFQPVILMPKKTDWNDTEQLQYVLLHEYVHIRHYDALIKLISTFALCIHWFNPFVWVMYLLFNRDIELACDENVVRQFGENSKSIYARMLIHMEAKKSGIAPFCNNFSKNAIEERITAIMKIKKTSVFTPLIAIGLIVGVATTFATSASSHSDKKEKIISIPNTNFSDEEYAKLLALQLNNYEKMTVSEYQNKVWELTDTMEYRDLLERFSQDETLNEMRDNNEICSFLFYILEPLTAENWQSRTFGGYTASNFPQASDHAMLEYSLTLNIQKPDKLTVGEYNTTRLGMINDLSNLLQNKTTEELQNDELMTKTIQTAVDDLIKQWQSDKLHLAIVYSYQPLIVPSASELENTTPLQNTEESEPRPYPNGTEEDYRSLLTLKTPTYQQMSVKDFNMALLEWANESYERLERINTDTGWDDFQVSLSSEELSFIKLTVRLSGMENTAYVQGSYSGAKEEDPIYGSYSLPEKRTIENGRAAWCDLSYQFAYHITDKEILTIGERDRCVGSMINHIQQFWNEKNIEELLKLNENDIVKEFQKFAKKYSTQQITITIHKDQVFFENMDERNVERNLDKKNIAGKNADSSTEVHAVNTADADKQGISIMDESGTWGESIERLLPSMSSEAIEEMLIIYLDRHIFAGISTSEDIMVVEQTIQIAYPYMTKESIKKIKEHIKLLQIE